MLLPLKIAGKTNQPNPVQSQYVDIALSLTYLSYSFFGFSTLYRVASINPNVVKVPPIMAHSDVR